MKSEPNLSTYIQNHSKYKIQIIYTQINRDKNNVPTFKDHYYYLDSSNYFYCASLVKLPCSIIALEKINSLKDKGVTRATTMFTDSLTACQKKVTSDTSNISGLPSVEQYIKRMLLVSDNLAFGRIYEFLTPDYLHEKLAYYGMPNMRIVHRFDGACKGINNLTSNQIRFVDSSGNLLYQQPQIISKKKYTIPISKAEVGTAYIDNSGKKVNGSKDFSTYNYMSLTDIHKTLRKLVFMKYDKESHPYNITNDDWNFLMKYLSMYPGQSKYPNYATKTYFDSYKKYFLFGDSKKPIKDKHIKIYNIVGQSYGFMVDCAYIVDFKNKREFMLSAVIYANEQDVINTGKYEYNKVALPYLSALGKLFYQYELKRKYPVSPDLLTLPSAN